MTRNAIVLAFALVAIAPGAQGQPAPDPENGRYIFSAVPEGMLRLEVEDHGGGIPASAPQRGLGIVGMRERAALVGGTIEFVRPTEGGTLVRLWVPMAGAHV